MVKFLLYTLVLLMPALAQAKFHPEATSTLEKTKFWTGIYFKPDTTVAVMDFRVWFEHEADVVFEVLTDTNSFRKLSNYKNARTLSPALFKKIDNAKPKTAAEVVALIGGNKISSFHNRQKGHNWTDYVFYEFNFPWPVTDRWVVQKLKIDESNSKQGEYKLSYKISYGNFKALFGQWKLKPVEGHPGWTEFQGHYESDAGIAVPKFLTKQGMKVGFKKDINNYRKSLKTK